jgi:chromate transporter
MVFKLLDLGLKLFLVSLLTFGGGMAMIPMFKDLLVSAGYLTSDELYNFVGISEVFPGAFAVDFAVFTGNQQVWLIGGIVAAIAISLPSFAFAYWFGHQGQKISRSTFFTKITHGFKPVMVGLIFGAGLTLFKEGVLPQILTPSGSLDFDLSLVLTFVALLGITIFWKKINPLVLVLIGGTIAIGSHYLFAWFGW